MAARNRKNFFPTFFLSILSWAVVAFFIFFVDPEVIRDFPISSSYSLFFLFSFIAIFFTSSLLFLNTRRGFLTAFGLIVFLYLRLFGLGHILNAFLLFSFLIVLEIAISRN